MLNRKITDNPEQTSGVPTQNPVIEYVEILHKTAIELQTNSFKTTKFKDGLDNIRECIKRLLLIINSALPAIEKIKTITAPVKLSPELTHRMQAAERLTNQSEETLKNIQQEYSKRKRLIAITQEKYQQQLNEIDNNSEIQRKRALQQKYKSLLSEKGMIQAQLTALESKNQTSSIKSIFGSNKKNPTQLCYVELNLKAVEKEIAATHKELGDELSTDFYNENSVLLTECANQLLRVNKEFGIKIKAAEDELKLRETNLFKLYVESEKIKFQSVCSIDRDLMILIVKMNALLGQIDQAIDLAYQQYQQKNKVQSSRNNTLFPNAEPNFASLIKIANNCQSQLHEMNGVIRCPESGNLTIAELMQRYTSTDEATRAAFLSDKNSEDVVDTILPRTSNEHVTPLLSSERLLRRPGGV